MARFIEPDSFSRHLYKVAPYLFSNKKQPFKARKIGLFVSGGADSMALAYLLNEVKHPQLPDLRLFAAKAFTVDHGARAESGAEAIQVQKNLQSLGIDSEILKLTWAPGELESLLKGGFEEAARRRRYQAVARAAKTQQIHELFAGHHLDDQMETLLLRLVRNRNPNLLGFQGMASISAMPCTETTFGVRNRSVPESSVLRHPECGDAGPSRDILVGEKQPNEGQHLIRPLLPFPKHTILRTCSRFSIPYVDDRTNVDPTFTTRNAVRYLRTNHSLPRALTAEGLAVLQRNANTKVKDSKDRSQHVLNQVVNLRLHSHTGMIQITLKQFHHLRTPGELRGFSYAMARLLELTSPAPSDTWPILLDRDHTMELTQYLFQAPGSFSGRQMCTAIIVKGAILRLIDDDSTNETVTFMIRREPFRRSEMAANTRIFQLKPKSEDAGGDHYWFLWDHRFWIGVRSMQQNFVENFVVRPYQPEDVPDVKVRLGTSPNADKFKQQMDYSAPGDIRFTMPVLTYCGKVVAFPTMAYQFVPTSMLSIRCRFARSRRTAIFLNENIFKSTSV
ncbi:hypothetical protein LTR70_004152 [Exophiala xenobiotica]|uniref:tRNA(Ile)-lysidine synthetase n=1 Tax=Lithohypha guttulata TaxID=1690604 RepID=A0ABR0KGB4_9EURO|nr:hypothetical protein LTR24_003566 [Lithohypha guttulata]KAK5321596.1 hypothetical protein LTR70_004152 [Exophiala xenobiotica]